MEIILSYSGDQGPISRGALHVKKSLATCGSYIQTTCVTIIYSQGPVELSVLHKTTCYFATKICCLVLFFIDRTQKSALNMHAVQN